MKENSDFLKKPPVDQVHAYTKAFDYFNETLFDNELPTPMLTLTRNAKIIGGYFSPNKWTDEDGNHTHELALNANQMTEGDYVTLFAVLIHEMTHLWQQEKGSPGRTGYHNREIADKFIALGLQPKDIKTGKETGQSIATTLIENGKAEKAIMELPQEIIFPWQANESMEDNGTPNPNPTEKPTPRPGTRNGTRAKYTCPVCGLNAWAKGGARLYCMDCDRALVEQVKD